MKLKYVGYAIIAFAAISCFVRLASIVDLDLISLSVVKRYAASMFSFKEEQYLLAVGSYLALFVFLSACFIPVTVIMTVLGGYLFGAFWGGIFASIGATLGGSVVFILVRYFFRERVHARYAEKFSRFSKTFEHSATYLLCLQISPVTPTFFINLFTGLTAVPLWTYVWTAFIGMLPGSLVYAYAGEKLHYLKNLDALMSPTAFIVLLIISLLGILPSLISRLRR